MYSAFLFRDYEIHFTISVEYLSQALTLRICFIRYVRDLYLFGLYVGLLLFLFLFEICVQI